MGRIGGILTVIGVMGLVACQPAPASNVLQDKADIADLVNAWGFHRDQNNWSELNEVFTSDGQISVSWICGPHKKFVEISEALSKDNSDILKHQTGVPLVHLNDDRALSEVNVTISVRTATPFGDVDSTTSGRFLDRLVKDEGEWKIQERVAIYEKDRLDPVGANSIPASFYDEAAEFPEAIKFLAMALKTKNVPISPQTMLDKTEALREVYEASDRWLETGSKTDPFWVDCSSS